ncbi:MAG: LysM peptidoglycan-binding domain-containing protein [Kiritimatiellaceae bacterium]|nr:LysM peptidoglycan-binding domain-containing protein [Kiritimatiellaceae bacterium]
MKSKVVGFQVLVMHIAVLAGFSLMQGCAMFKSSSAPKDQPVVLPAAPEVTDAGLLPVVAAPASAEKVHSVLKGETLSSIASSYGVSWKKLAECNNIANPNQLKVGQELRIPGTSGSSISGAPAKHTAPVSSRPIPGAIKQGSSYTVQKGDTLASIAKRCGLTVSELKTANDLKNDNLSVGKKLTVPKKGAAVKAPAKAIPAKAANPAVEKKSAAAPLPAPAPLADAAPATASTGTVSSASPSAPAVAAPVAKAASAPVYEHVLYPGETLDDVARQYGSSQQEIMKLNNITDPSSIKPGTKLLVPIPE